MQAVKNYLSSNIAHNINECAIALLKNNSDLRKFRMKLKIEGQSKHRITIHAFHEGTELCATELGLDVWKTYKLAEMKFLNKIRKVKSTKISKIKKSRLKYSRLQGGDDNVSNSAASAI